MLEYNLQHIYNDKSGLNDQGLSVTTFSVDWRAVTVSWMFANIDLTLKVYRCANPQKLERLWCGQKQCCFKKKNKKKNQLKIKPTGIKIAAFLISTFTTCVGEWDVWCWCTVALKKNKWCIHVVAILGNHRLSFLRDSAYCDWIVLHYEYCLNY